MSKGAIDIIGVSGKAGSGKDFVGREVLRPAGYTQYAFAWPMKMQAIGECATYEEVFVTKPPHIRKLLQEIGTERGWKRFGENYWLDIAGGWLRTMRENMGVTRVYITDVRFPHEVEWIKAQGGKVIRLEHGDREYPLAGTPAAEHLSETALDSYPRYMWDAIVTNSSGTSVDYIRRVLRTFDVLPPARMVSQLYINDAQLEMAMIDSGRVLS